MSLIPLIESWFRIPLKDVAKRFIFSKASFSSTRRTAELIASMTLNLSLLSSSPLCAPLLFGLSKNSSMVVSIILFVDMFRGLADMKTFTLEINANVVVIKKSYD